MGDLTNSITDELAIEGLHFATNSVLNEKHFRNEVLPELIRNIYLPVGHMKDSIDIKRQSLLSLPHDYSKNNGKYIVKNVPEKTLEEPEAHTVMNLTSKCKLEVFRNDGNLHYCTNVEQEYQDIYAHVSQ